MAQSDLPAFEAVLRSPQGEIRVWLDPATKPDAEAHAVRTSLRIDYGDEADRLVHDQAALRLVAQLTRAVRGLSGAGTAEVAAAAAAPSVGPWLVERTEAEPTTRTLVAHLFQDYLAWCDRRAFTPLSRFDFGRELEQRGSPSAGKIRQGATQGHARGGLRLRPVAVEPALKAGDAR